MSRSYVGALGLVRCRAIGVTLTLGAALAVSACAQQSSSGSATAGEMQPCPPGTRSLGTSPLAVPAPGMTDATGATGRTDAGTGRTAAFGGTKPVSDTSKTASTVSANPLTAPAPGMTDATGATGRTDDGTGRTATFGGTNPATDTSASATRAARATGASGPTIPAHCVRI